MLAFIGCGGGIFLVFFLLSLRAFGRVSRSATKGLFKNPYPGDNSIDPKTGKPRPWF